MRLARVTTLLTFLAAVFLAGAVGAGAQTTIRFVKWPGANYDPALDPDVAIVEAFNRANPDVQVELDVIPNYQEVLMVQLAGGIYPDLLRVNPGMIPEFQPFGLLEELSPYVERSGAFIADLWPIATTSKEIFGGLYAIPITIGPNALYYNVSAFNEAGLQSPHELHRQNNWHWETFLTAARRLTIDRTGDGRPDIYGYKGSPQNWPIFVVSARGKIYTDDGKRLLVDDAAMDALEFLRSLIYDHGVWTIQPPYYTEAFPQGLAAMIIAQPRYVNLYREQAQIEWDTAVVMGRTPDMPFQERFRLGGISLAAPSAHKEAGWRFIQHFLSYESQLRYAESGEVPMNRQAAAALLTADPSKPPQNLHVFMETLERAIPSPDPVVPASVTNALNRELNKVWNRGEPVRTVIDGARPIIDALLAEQP